MSTPLDPLLEALASSWRGLLTLAASLFGLAGVIAFVVPDTGRFDFCRLAIAVAFAGFGLFFLVTGTRSRIDRRP